MPALKKSKLIWDGVAGDEDTALRAEYALGSQMAAELRRQAPPTLDTARQTLAQELCERLAAFVRDKRRVFQCEVFLDSVPNALAFPGGFVFVSESLFDFCENRPDEMAFVVGHEMAHVIRGHAWERVLNESAVRFASAASSRLGPVGNWVSKQGMALLKKAYARDCENEADEMGLRLAAAAGYDPAAALSLFRRLDQLTGGGEISGEYFSTHPPARERLARLTTLVKNP